MMYVNVLEAGVSFQVTVAYHHRYDQNYSVNREHLRNGGFSQICVPQITVVVDKGVTHVNNEREKSVVCKVV